MLPDTLKFVNHPLVLNDLYQHIFYATVFLNFVWWVLTDRTKRNTKKAFIFALWQNLWFYNCFGRSEQNNITFLVFGRLSDANFLELADLALPASLKSICQAVPSEDYRNDISSSAIRASQRQNTSLSES